MEWLKRYFSVSKGAAMAMLILALTATQKGIKSDAFLAALLIVAPIFFILGGLIEGFRQWRRDRKASPAPGGHPPAPAPYR